MALPPTYNHGTTKIAVSQSGYLIWKTGAGRIGKNKSHASWRDWKLVAYAGSLDNPYGNIDSLGKIRLPEKYIGKKIRIHIEVMEDRVNEEEVVRL